MLKIVRIKSSKPRGYINRIMLELCWNGTVFSCSETPKVCKSKFSEIFKAYKDDKQMNSISGEARHTCKFYDVMDTWYYQNRVAMKHISASSNDNGNIGCGSHKIKKEEYEDTSKIFSSARKVSRKITYWEKTLNLISQLVVNSQHMAKSMQVASEFMSNLDKHIEKLIEKL